MSELEKQAQKEVEQVCFAYEEAGKSDDIKGWKKYYELRDLLAEKIGLANRPRLTIPDWVVEYHKKLDWYMNPENKDWKSSRPTEQEQQKYSDWKSSGKNEKIMDIYLASKALGVDLVEVVR